QQAGAEADQANLPGLEEVLFSDIFEIKLADQTKVRGCFALWKQTRHILAIAFESHMRAELVVNTIHLIDEAIKRAIFHSDQGSQYSSEDSRKLLKDQGITCSLSQRGECWDTQSMMVKNACQI
ncbi:MAG: transposase family protein, partial [Pseudomonadota bacterium]|nr:transposase family protein [Pseudomonadota bacterium]